MVTFGLTGSICCGKSNVTKTFRQHGIPIVDADIVAREVVVPGSIGLSKIIKSFGDSILNHDGTLNRLALGNLVFSNQQELHRLNQIMSPLIMEECNIRIDKFHQDGYNITGIDGALLIETSLHHQFRPLIVVHCREELQLERLMSRNGLTAAEAMNRIRAQLPQQEKIRMADYLINSSGTFEESIQQTKLIIQKLKDHFHGQKTI